VNDLVNLENQNAYVKIINKGESPPAFSINTHYKYAPFNIPKEADMHTREIVKTLSRYRYGRDRAMVEAEVRERAELEDTSMKQVSGSGMGGGAPLGPQK
jgi:hypothetical protein